MTQAVEPFVYQGQFGEFTITDDDRQGVKIYRAGLLVAALSFAITTLLVLMVPTTPLIVVTGLYTLFCLALGVSLWTIHIYMVALHRALQIFWAIGALAALVIGWSDAEPFAATIYHHPWTILGIGFTFAALTGIFFKEAFCFNRLETKFLTPIVPMLLLGHLTSILPVEVEKGLAIAWAILFLIFALRKVIQAIPDDIGDKSVFEYLEHQARDRA